MVENDNCFDKQIIKMLKHKTNLEILTGMQYAHDIPINFPIVLFKGGKKVLHTDWSGFVCFVGK